MLVRIFTENKNPEKLEELIGSYFEGFTIIKADGFWRLQKENSLIIEVEIFDKKEKEKIEKLANDIKRINNQEAILIQEIENNSYLI